MRIKKISALAAVPFLAISLAACGGSDGGNVSKEQFVDGYAKAVVEVQDADLSDEETDAVKKVAGCIYDEVKDDVSNDTLKVVASSDNNGNISEEDAQTLSSALQKCGEEGAGDQDQSSSTD